MLEQYHDGLAGSKGTELLQNIVQRTQLNSSQPVRIFLYSVSCSTLLIPDATVQIPDSMGLETLTRKYIQSAQIVLHSIYFPGIYYWHAVLPSHSVGRVVRGVYCDLYCYIGIGSDSVRRYVGTYMPV